MIPNLEYAIDGSTLKFRYTDIVEDFDMPVQVNVNQTTEWIYPTADWKTQSFDASISDFEIDRDFYIESKEIK
tara:strand:- start:551 stop:769 length:219 start_codon:yes stop_codon:yes gene_type:complete